MSRVAGLTDGNKAEHSIALIDGATGAPPAMFVAGVQAISMGNADVTLVMLAPSSTQTQLRSNVLRVDPQGAGTPDLMLPSAATMKGVTLHIYNAADAAESFRVRDSADSTTLATLAQAGKCIVVSDGTSYLPQTVVVSTTDFGAPGLAADVVAESTAAAGVTVDGLLLKDGFVVALDNQGVKFGTGTDITVAWDASKLAITQAAPNSAIDMGVDGAGIDVIFRGDTAGAAMTWDQSVDKLIFTGQAAVQGLRVASAGATAITTTRAMTLADSGGVFTVAQSSAYDIDLPSPTTGAGFHAIFQLVSPGANNVTITVAGSAATFEGTITIDGATIPATGSTLTFATGASVLGDNIEVWSTSTSKYFVRAIASGAGGITIA